MLKSAGFFLSNVTQSRKSALLYGIIELSNQKGARTMKITVNTIREKLKRTGGCFPCRPGDTEEKKRMCRGFKEQISASAYEGYCHCMLYYKSFGD